MTEDIRLECLKMAVQTAMTFGDPSPQAVVERAKAYEQFVSGDHRQTPTAKVT